ncbi:MAG: glycosyltransferase family 4 protein [Bacteroidales bacterium]|nr:glycosyltransferase family 4 protein [Bacteroidales bacterium]
MKIAVNTRLLLPNKLEGIGWFTYETLKRITTQHKEHQFVFMFDRKYSDEFIFSDNIQPVVIHPQARHPVLWYLYFETGIRLALHRHKPGLFLSPDGWLSLGTSTKSMAVIHDLNFFHYPEFIPWHVRKYYQYFFPRFVQKADRIATVSEYTKHDIVSRFKYDHKKIDVVYNGANESFRPYSDEEKQKVRDEYTQGCPYFLFVGLIHRRKNLTNLIKAFNLFKESHCSNLKLLVVGPRKWWTSELQEAYDNSKYRNEIIFTGRMGIEPLSKIMASSFAVTYPSFFEGFGIPILEALKCDVPVITSITSSMPEVGGEAALYVDPQSVDSIKEVMIQLFLDTNLRDDLIQKGRIQRQKFSWDNTADLLWKSIETCMGKLSS